MLALKDRVKELTTTTGTGTLTLVSAPSGYRRFSSVLSNGDTTYYCIESGSQWEVGLGTYSANTLARTTVLASSNANTLIDITTARSFVFITYAADKAVYKDSANRTVIGASGLIFSDASVQTTAATTPDLSPYLTISSAASTYLTQSSATTLLAAKADLVGGLVPSAQLPSYVDDVIEAANLAAFPGTGETGKIYVAIDTGYTYRWSGSVYVRINEVDLSSYLTISTAASTYLPLAGGTLVGDLKFTDATYDIGKSGATRPRDGFFSGNLTADKLSVGGASLTGYLNLPQFQWINWGGTNYIKAGNSYDGVVGITLISGGTLADLGAIVPYNNQLKIRYGTNAQTLQVYETYTSDTSLGTFQIKANAGAAYQIGSAIGSAGGTNRAISLGHWNSGGTFTSALSIDTAGAATFASTINTMDFVGTNYNLGVGYSTSPSLAFAATALGWTARATHIYSISIGASSASSADNQFTVGNSTNVSKFRFGTGVASVTFDNPLILGQLVSTSGSPTAFTITGAAHTTLTTAEVTDGYFNAARTVNFGATGGTVANQRTWRFTAPTFTAAAATTLTIMSTVSISGPPVASTNVTGTNAYALNVESGKIFVTNPENSTSALIISGTTSGIQLSGNTNSAISFATSGSCHIRQIAANQLNLGISGGDRAYWQNGWYVAYDYDTGYSWTTNNVSSGTLWGLVSNTAHVVTQKSGTNAQTFRIAGTVTSATAYELLNIKGKSSANFEIGPENGSAGGTLRGLTIGGYSAGTTTIAPWLTFTNAGIATFASTVTATGFISIDRYAQAPNVCQRRAEGTEASPTQVLSGTTMAQIGSYPYHDGAAFHTNPGGNISFVSLSDITSTSQETEIRFGTAASGATTATTRLSINTDLVIASTTNLTFSTGTGSKIGTGTTQKIGFWDATPVAQQTTASTSATVVGGGGTTVTQTDTFDGYTLAQIVKALRTIGILA